MREPWGAGPGLSARLLRRADESNARAYERKAAKASARKRDTDAARQRSAERRRAWEARRREKRVRVGSHGTVGTRFVKQRDGTFAREEYDSSTKGHGHGLAIAVVALHRGARAKGRKVKHDRVS